MTMSCSEYLQIKFVNRFSYDYIGIIACYFTHIAFFLLIVPIKKNMLTFCYT